MQARNQLIEQLSFIKKTARNDVHEIGSPYFKGALNTVEHATYLGAFHKEWAVYLRECESETV